MNLISEEIMFKGKNVVLGVTGSIAAYKAVDVASKLVQSGIDVDVILTEAAAKFVSALSFSSITHRQVHIDMFAPVSDFHVEHVSLAERADVIVIAPATANTIAKLATGIADDLLSCTVLSARGTVIIAPAMDLGMYENQVTRSNLEKLRSRGFSIVGPAQGRLASGLSGKGRFVESAELLAAIFAALGKSGDLAGKHLVITAGGTREPIDPVRYIGNYSSGKMGFAIAEAARNRGASVSLISASTSVTPPYGVDSIIVQTANEMRDAVTNLAAQADVLIMAAAVADYQPKAVAGSKLKRKQAAMDLSLTKTPDIIGEISGDFIKVGFAAESDAIIENAAGKLKAKGLDFIVANDITAKDAGFGVDTNRVTIIDSNGDVDHLPLMLRHQATARDREKRRHQ